MRRHGRTDTLLLYYFRTPPYVKVGRAAIDADAMARLEQQYPDIKFEWDKILREPPQMLSEQEAVRRKEQRDAREARRKRKRPGEVEAAEAVALSDVSADRSGALEQDGLELEAQDDDQEDSPAEPDVITSEIPESSPVSATGDAVRPVEGARKRRRRRRRRGKKREGEPGSNPPSTEHD